MTQNEIEFPTRMNPRTPPEQWPDRFRSVVELFHGTEPWEMLEPSSRMPSRDDRPYVLHASTRAPLRPDGDREYTWHVLFNPYSGGGEREAFIVGGGPLLPRHTVHGADDPEKDFIATDDDLARIHPGSVSVFCALTKVAGMHSRGENWRHSDDAIEQQFDTVLDRLSDDPDAITVPIEGVSI